MGIVRPKYLIVCHCCTYRTHYCSLFCSCWCVPVEEQEHLCWSTWWGHSHLDPIWIAWLPSSYFRLPWSHILSGCSLSLV